MGQDPLGTQLQASTISRTCACTCVWPSSAAGLGDRWRWAAASPRRTPSSRPRGVPVSAKPMSNPSCCAASLPADMPPRYPACHSNDAPTSVRIIIYWLSRLRLRSLWRGWSTLSRRDMKAHPCRCRRPKGIARLGTIASVRSTK